MHGCWNSIGCFRYGHSSLPGRPSYHLQPCLKWHTVDCLSPAPASKLVAHAYQTIDSCFVHIIHPSWCARNSSVHPQQLQQDSRTSRPFQAHSQSGARLAARGFLARQALELCIALQLLRCISQRFRVVLHRQHDHLPICLPPTKCRHSVDEKSVRTT